MAFANRDQMLVSAPTLQERGGAFRAARDSVISASFIASGVHYLMTATNALSATVYWVASIDDLTGAQYGGGNLPLSNIRTLRGPY